MDEIEKKATDLWIKALEAETLWEAAHAVRKNFDRMHRIHSAAVSAIAAALLSSKADTADKTPVGRIDSQPTKMMPYAVTSYDQMPQWFQEIVAKQEPQAWIRHCSDGGIEGPIAHHQCEEVRRNSGVWTPLYPMPLSINGGQHGA
ncbi:hypothetical protein ACM9XA_03545 [Xanthomonas sacchari]